ncbi:MAG: PDZ domain-containing protein [Planctomycetes bacterium]|nr:PDZ domain-containing protein [Planctomycetota bacterium]MCC7169200.1 PDZ domain-containing protein [Planctomycetota bacterium]
MKFRTLALAVSVLILGGCRSWESTTFEDGGLLLREVKSADGSVTEYRLYPGVSDKPTINRTQTTPFERPDIQGIVVADVNASLAKKLGTNAWQGVYVQRVLPRSAAATAGVTSNDVILSVAGQSVTNEQQFFEVLKSTVTSTGPVEFTIRRGVGAEATETRVTVVPTLNKGTESRTDSIPLESSSAVQHYTGLQVATVPPTLSAEIWGNAEETTIVSGVVTGSPAYHAGLRRGDRVVSADGKTGPKLADVRKAVYARAAAPIAESDSSEVVEASALGSASGDLTLTVEGPLGAHSAALPVDDTLMKETKFHFPILFDYSSGVDYTRWSCLDFVFQFIGNYDQRFRPSPTRQAREESELSLFPLGMFEFRTTPTSREYTMFWIIDWSTRND